jgi:pimeloyl-ACP methyl ester carboxylesterase
LQRPQRHSSPWSNPKQFVFFAFFIFFSFVFSSFNSIRVRTITFSASDGLDITADEYFIGPDKPYVLLFHEQGSSRGEYQDIARRLCKLDYNCLAVDLRNGDNFNFVSNETSKGLRSKQLDTGLKGIELDAQAAIRYASDKSNLPVVLFGSGANGSLSLKIAQSNEDVNAVIALSPGEYFMPEIKIQEAVTSLKKPVFIASSKAEFPYVSELVSGIERDYVSFFEPSRGAGDRGTRSFSEDYEFNDEYWFALMLFFKDLI